MNSIAHTSTFFYFISEIHFFHLESIPLTILLFFMWNVSLFKMVQLFVDSNPIVWDYYLKSLWYIGNFLFSNDIVDNSNSGDNFVNIVFTLLLLAYISLLIYIVYQYKKTLDLTEKELKAFRISTFIVYMLSFYIFLNGILSIERNVSNGDFAYLLFGVFNLTVTITVVFII
jgi:hypothetical protein